MQILDVKKKAPKWLQNWIWEGLGLRLGKIWDGLGSLLSTFGGFLAVFWVFWINLFSSIGPRWGLRGLLERSWIDFGGFWEGLGWILGGFGQDFGRLGCGKNKKLPKVLKSFKNVYLHGIWGFWNIFCVLSRFFARFWIFRHFSRVFAYFCIDVDIFAVLVWGIICIRCSKWQFTLQKFGGSIAVHPPNVWKVNGSSPSKSLEGQSQFTFQTFGE